ncbi:MAG: hypothetical protein PHC88_02635 [Terrimicrobiaceae bacterium]|nr:hypothetical protein [Terrimicrobiaceae bacterium]
MNSKLLKAITAVTIALVAAAPLSFAAAVSPSQFNTQLLAKIGTKKGLAAANAAAGFYGKTLKDALNKKNAEKYAKSIVKALKKPVPAALQGAGTNSVVKQLLAGYFTGKTKFNLNDKTYNKALNALLKGIPSSARTTPTSNAIYTSIKTFAVKKGSTQAEVFTYYQGVASKNNLPPPPVS